MSEQLEKLKLKSRGFEASRDLAVRHPSASLIEGLAQWAALPSIGRVFAWYLNPQRCSYYNKLVIFELSSRIDIFSISYDIALRWMLQEMINVLWISCDIALRWMLQEMINVLRTTCDSALRWMLQEMINALSIPMTLPWCEFYKKI